MCAPASVLADETRGGVTSDEEARRSALYREGVQLANAGRWKEAVQRFLQVVAIRSAPPALYTLAQAEEHTGALASAEKTYEKALTAARASGASDVADAAARALSAIAPRVPRLVIVSPAGVDNATATIDGVPAPIGETVKVDAGDRLVVVSAPGRRSFEATVRVAEGQSLDVRPSLAPAAEAEAAPKPGLASTPESPVAAEPAQRGGPSSFPTVPVVVGAVGIAAGATGLVLRLVGQSQYDGASSNCTANACTSQSDVDRGNAGRTQIIAGTVLLGVGAAAVGSALVLWFVAPRRDDGVHVGVLPNGHGGGAFLSGRF
jgi:hypothetical protein